MDAIIGDVAKLHKALWGDKNRRRCIIGLQEVAVPVAGVPCGNETYGAGVAAPFLRHLAGAKRDDAPYYQGLCGLVVVHPQ